MKDRTLSLRQLWHTGRKNMICAGQCSVNEVSKALLAFICSTEICSWKTMARGSPGNAWGCPTLCFQALHHVPLGQWFLHRDCFTAKITQEQSSTTVQSEPRKKKNSLMFCVLRGKNTSWQTSITSYLYPIHKSKGIPNIQRGTECAQKQYRTYSLSIQEETPI